MKETQTDLVINKLTTAQYEELLASDSIQDNEIYYIIDDNDRFYLKEEVYTKEEINKILQDYTPSTSEDTGTKVVANPVLSGNEDILESITIDDTNYSLGGQEMIFSEDTSEGKTLKTINLSGDTWSIETGSIIKPNVTLDGDEDQLESAEIDGVKFTLKGEEMVFSENEVENAKTLKTIHIGNEDWKISSDDANSSIDMSLYATKADLTTRVAELLNSAPEELDTLGELATAIQENQSIMETLNSAITNKVDKDAINGIVDDLINENPNVASVDNKEPYHMPEIEIVDDPSGRLYTTELSTEDSQSLTGMNFTGVFPAIGASGTATEETEAKITFNVPLSRLNIKIPYTVTLSTHESDNSVVNAAIGDENGLTIDGGVISGTYEHFEDNMVSINDYFYTKEEVDSKVPNIVISDEEPTEPVEGMIWFKPVE